MKIPLLFVHCMGISCMDGSKLNSHTDLNHLTDFMTKTLKTLFIMAGLTSYMLCLHAFPCEQVPRQKPTSTTFIPMGLCHNKKQKQ